MPNIKKGDPLIYKSDGKESRILEIVGDLYFVEWSGEKGRAYGYTLEGLKETFELPEEKWMPESGDYVFAIEKSYKGKLVINAMEYSSLLEHDRNLLEQGLIKKTKEAAEAKLAEILKLLQA